jgi:hypothetical protein
MPRRKTPTLNLTAPRATPARLLASAEASKLRWGIAFPSSRTAHHDGVQYLVFTYGNGGNILVQRESDAIVVQHPST